MGGRDVDEVLRSSLNAAHYERRLIRKLHLEAFMGANKANPYALTFEEAEYIAVTYGGKAVLADDGPPRAWRVEVPAPTGNGLIVFTGRGVTLFDSAAEFALLCAGVTELKHCPHTFIQIRPNGIEETERDK